MPNMSFRNNQDLKTLLHPYIFVLKENPGIQKDYLDYSLLMMQVGRPEMLKSPLSYKKKRSNIETEFELIHSIDFLQSSKSLT
jgi:hypothetical protein